MDITKQNLDAIINGDAGAYCGANGSNPMSFKDAKLCTERKIEFAIKQLKEIEDYEPWGDDHAHNLSLTMDLIEHKRKELEKMLEILNE